MGTAPQLLSRVAPLATVALLGMSACKEEAPAEETAASYHDTGRQLPLPDTDPALVAQGLDAAWARALELHVGVPWALQEATLDTRTAGCPDLYLGAPLDEDRAEEGGQHWLDSCTPEGAPHYRGQLWWDTSLEATGSAEEAAGQQLSARRSLAGTASVAEEEADGSEVLRFSFDGAAEDQWTAITVGEQTRFTWTSQLAGSVGGSLVDEGPAGGRFRTDTYRYVSGPDTPTLELRTETYLYEPVLAGAFDSFGAELSWAGEGAAGPEDCALEPRGWIGVRDPEAYWFDLRFLPLDGDIDPAACDGCGELFVRGIEEVSLGQVCPTWSWEGLQPPDIREVRWTLRSLEEGSP